MNTPAYIGLSILELSKILMYDFWYDYVNKNMVKNQDCVIWIKIKTDGIYKDIAGDAETRFDTSNYELERSLPKGKKR